MEDKLEIKVELAVQFYKIYCSPNETVYILYFNYFFFLLKKQIKQLKKKIIDRSKYQYIKIEEMILKFKD